MLFSEDYLALTYYTLSHSDREAFLHQHAVDAQTAQTANAETKPISLVFALAGLCLAVEKQYSGRAVQQEHMRLAKRKLAFPVIPLPLDRGELTVAQVLARAPGKERDKAIRDWCASVWAVYAEAQSLIRDYLAQNAEFEGP